MLVLPARVPEGIAERDDPPDERDLAAARREWQVRRTELLRAARRAAPATSPSGLEHVDEAVRTGGPGSPAGRAKALALGSAVHRVMELCDLADETSVSRAAAAVAAELERPDLTDEAAELAGACWRAEPVRAAAAAGSGVVHRELPIGALVEGVVLSGAIDLVYLDGTEWVVVDYKTDRNAEPEVLQERYEPQGAAYALAVEAATGGVVREVCFVAARANGLVVRVPVDDGLRERARAEIAAAAGAGRALRPDELGRDGDRPDA